MSGVCVCAGCLGYVCGLCMMCEWCVCLRGLFGLYVWTVCDVRVVYVFAQVVWVVYVGITDN